MKQFDFYEAKTNLSKISKLLEDKNEDKVIISRDRIRIYIIPKHAIIMKKYKKLN